MKKLLIVYHSQSGTCARLAGDARQGAIAEREVETHLLRAWDADTAAVLAAQGLLLVAAENSGALAGGMKDFLDRTFYPVHAQQHVIPYALLISAGNDGRGAAQQSARIASGYPLVAAAEPVILRGDYCADHAAAAREYGQALATGLSMGIF